MLDPYVPAIFQYMNLLCPSEGHLNLELIKMIAGLIGDLAELYGNKISQLIVAPFIERIVGILERSQVKDHVQLSRWVKSTIQKILKK